MSDNNTKTFYHDCGKGDRPRGTGWKNYYDNFDAIFGKKDESVKEEAGCIASNTGCNTESDGQDANVG
jgi:hypothetical protein